MMMSFFRKSEPLSPIVIYNSLTKKKEAFVPVKGKNVGMYTCGPTVYGPAHIGNLRSFVFADILRRTLEYSGYEVKQVMNITDIGHLVGDGDEGDDKMTAGLKREGMDLTLENMLALGSRYEALFVEDLKLLNVGLPFVFPRASEHIGEQIAVIQTLVDKGYAYKISDGVYFDIGKFPKYGALGGSASVEHSRIGVSAQKHDPRDFSLWKFDTNMGWESPWGKGFPGWHIECSAMAMKYLGKSFDIHTGGIDLAHIHHNNEIAQSEAATGKPFVKYFLHGEFLLIDGQKIAKSIGNTITLTQLQDKGILPLAYRYWLLTGHYRQQLNFTWEAIKASETALYRALRIFSDLQGDGLVLPTYRARFTAAIRDDLNTAEAIAIMWELLKDETVTNHDKRTTLIDFDRILGIGFQGTVHSSEVEKIRVVSEQELPENVRDLVAAREEARKYGNWEEADRLRYEIGNAGYILEDSKEGTSLRRKSTDES